MPSIPPPKGLLDKIAGKLREPPSFSQAAGSAASSPGAAGSLLCLAAACYGQHQGEDDLTQPTGFDPEVAALFEAIIECAYLVAVSDGEFDDVERGAFEHVVLAACAGKVTAAQLRSLLADLADLRAEDGEDKRVQMVSRAISRPNQAAEVLRVAALIAQVSNGVSAVERGVLDKLAARFQLDSAAVDRAVGEAARVLSD
jgi:tellurite resistance protein